MCSSIPKVEPQFAGDLNDVRPTNLSFYEFGKNSWPDIFSILRTCFGWLHNFRIENTCTSSLREFYAPFT